MKRSAKPASSLLAGNKPAACIPNKYVMQTDELKNPLRNLLESALPSKTYQRKRSYHPTQEEAESIYDLLNEHVFGNALTRPTLIFSKCHNFWGQCYGQIDLSIIIQINHRHPCVHWFVAVMAHEMVHQYQWQIDGAARQALNKAPLMSHGPTFMKWRKALKNFGIPLYSCMDANIFLKTQNLLFMPAQLINETTQL